MDLGLVEIAFTEADAAKREKMWQIRDAIIADLQAHFPALTQNSDSKYSIVLDQLMAQISWIPTLIQLGLTDWENLLTVLVCLVLAAFVAFHLVRRSKGRRGRRSRTRPLARDAAPA